MGIFDWLPRLQQHISMATIVVNVPADRVDPFDDPAKYKPNEHYARLWLVEARCPAQNDRQKDNALVFATRSEFLYAGRKIAVPAFLNITNLGATSLASRQAVSRPLTPLFPYRGGAMTFFGALLRDADRGDVWNRDLLELLEQLSAMLSTDRFSRSLELSDVIFDRTLKVTRDAKMEVGVNIGFDAKHERASGYFAVFWSPSSLRDINPVTLCVINSRLFVVGPGGFPSDTRPFPADRGGYLLLRVERLLHRPDLLSMIELNAAWREVMDAVRRDESVLVRDAGKRVIEEVIRTPTCTKRIGSC